MPAIGDGVSDPVAGSQAPEAVAQLSPTCGEEGTQRAGHAVMEVDDGVLGNASV